MREHAFASEPVTFESLAPEIGAEERARLDAWYVGYAALVFRMYERISADPEATASFRRLTDSAFRPTMTGKAESPEQSDPFIQA